MGTHDKRSARAPSSSPSEPSPPTSGVSALTKPVQFVRGVGPQRANVLAGIGLETVSDLIHYFPFRHEDQGPPRRINELLLDEKVTVIGAVEQASWQRPLFGKTRKPMLRAVINDASGYLNVVWFNATYLRDRLARGQLVRLYGKVGVDRDEAQMVNPQIDWLDPDADPATWSVSRIVPVYRATQQLSSGQLARIVGTALDEALPAVGEFLPEGLRREHDLPDRCEAIRAMHRPHAMDELDPARRRLAYEELFLMQLAITLQRRWRVRTSQAPRLTNSPKIDERIRLRFPFELTAAQNRVIAQIVGDLDRPQPMSRLLQGDVGSGKTVVALYAALVTVANKHQCVMLAPTEILATQHYQSIERYLADSRVRRCLLTGKTSRPQREQALEDIAAGRMDLVVGTQALLEKDIRFDGLGLVIVDEQHKFGVSQRATLKGLQIQRSLTEAGVTTARRSADDSRGRLEPHYLVMTATPIPRTLSMTVFGDLDVSIIDTLPPGRQPIKTSLVTDKQSPQAWATVRKRVAAGDQVYVVYPLVEESDALDLKAATVEVEHVARDLLPGSRVGLLHGRMKKSDKQDVMDAFARHELDVLVSTTVIEVGVDVPNATVMVIQHAERYGLAALHQLRGRVGRGSKPSICLLMADKLTKIARQRLKVLCATTDGFRIAEEDLRLRGPGELLGVRQHGYPELRMANLVDDADLLLQARDDAADLVRDDPALRRAEHAPLRDELRARFRDRVAFMHVG